MLTSPEQFYLNYLSSLLNSKLLYFQFKFIGSILGDKGLRYKKVFVKNIPIYPATKEEQEPFIELADKMIQLNRDLAYAKTPHEKKLLEKQISVTDKKIDKMVYGLYGLNKEEIAIIEDGD